jgi:hypothetical protein
MQAISDRLPLRPSATDCRSGHQRPAAGQAISAYSSATGRLCRTGKQLPVCLPDMHARVYARLDRYLRIRPRLYAAGPVRRPLASTDTGTDRTDTPPLDRAAPPPGRVNFPIRCGAAATRKPPGHGRGRYRTMRARRTGRRPRAAAREPAAAACTPAPPPPPPHKWMRPDGAGRLSLSRETTARAGLSWGACTAAAPVRHECGNSSTLASVAPPAPHSSCLGLAPARQDCTSRPLASVASVPLFPPFPWPPFRCSNSHTQRTCSVPHLQGAAAQAECTAQCTAQWRSRRRRRRRRGEEEEKGGEEEEGRRRKRRGRRRRRGTCRARRRSRTSSVVARSASRSRSAVRRRVAGRGAVRVALPSAACRTRSEHVDAQRAGPRAG